MCGIKGTGTTVAGIERSTVICLGVMKRHPGPRSAASDLFVHGRAVGVADINGGKSTQIWGLAANDVASIAVIADGRRYAARLQNNAFFAEVPTRVTAAARPSDTRRCARAFELDVTLTSGDRKRDRLTVIDSVNVSPCPQTVPTAR